MINLLPYKEKKIIERVRTLRLLQISIMGVICLALVSVVLLIPTLITINSRFNIFSKQITTLQQSGMIASAVDLASINQRAQRAQAKLSIPKEKQPTDYIDMVRSVVPRGIVVDRFVIGNDKLLEVSGIADNRELLQSFIKVLEADESIALVDSPVSNFVKSKNSEFKITISFK